MSRRAVRYICHDRAHRTQAQALAATTTYVWGVPSAANERRIHAPTLQLDPGGAGRTVVLPSASESAGAKLVVTNTADAAEDLSVQDPIAGTFVTVSQGESATVWSDGSLWYGTVSVAT